MALDRAFWKRQMTITEDIVPNSYGPHVVTWGHASRYTQEVERDLVVLCDSIMCAVQFRDSQRPRSLTDHFQVSGLRNPVMRTRSC